MICLSVFLILAYLFFIGSVFGWVLEVFYRKFISSANPQRKWINPGFCTGPYLPLYGTGLCLLYLISMLEGISPIKDPNLNKALLFTVMAICMTLIEFIAGYYSLTVSHVRLWDYSNEWGNIKGIICPKFSFYWAILGALYYFFIHPRILNALTWLSENLAFSFFIGLFFGVFIMDAAMSVQLVAKLKAYAKEYEIELMLEEFKQEVRRQIEEKKSKYHFFRPFKTDVPISEIIRDFVDTIKRNSDPLL